MASDTAESQPIVFGPRAADLIEKSPPDSVLKRKPIKGDDAPDCIIAQGGRRTAVIVFTGMAGRVGMPLVLFDRFLAELDLTAVYLRDPHAMAFFNGVPSLAPDYDGTVERLKELMVDLGAMTVHTLGNASGGIAAVSYGLDLRARTVIGFSAPLLLTPEAAAADQRVSVLPRGVLGDAVPAERRDLRARAMAARGQTRIHLFFDEESPEDRLHAEALEGAPRVELYPAPDCRNEGTIVAIARDGQLRGLLREAWGEKD